MTVGRIIELPDVRDVRALVVLLNERLRSIDEAQRRPAVLTADLDAGGHRITNLGEPRGGSDAASVFAVERRLLPIRSGLQETPAVQQGREQSRGRRGSAESYLLEITLAEDQEIGFASGTERERLTVILTQDGAGGHRVTWGANFRLASVEIGTDPDDVTVVEFIARSDGHWWRMGMPLIGQVGT